MYPNGMTAEDMGARSAWDFALIAQAARGFARISRLAAAVCCGGGAERVDPAHARRGAPRWRCRLAARGAEPAHFAAEGLE